MKKSVKSIIIEHFNEKVKNDEWDQVKTYGSESVNYYLQYPYLFAEDVIDSFDKKDLKILDYCCGTGIYSVYPSLNGHNVYGMDFSSKSIEIAKKKSEYYNLKENTFFSVMDAEDLKYNDDTFDIILVYGSLSYLSLDTSYKELNRVLKPGGKLIVIDSLGHNLFFRINRLKNINRWAKNINNLIGTLNINDIRLGKKYFKIESITYFDLFTVLGAFIFKSKKIFLLRHVLRIIDIIVLKIPLLRLCAFKFVAIYQSNKKH